MKVRPHWLERLSRDLPETVGLVGNKHLRMDDPTLVVHGGTADLMTGMHKAGPDESHFDRSSLEVWVTFACVFITRECLEMVGLLDERMLHFFTAILTIVYVFGWPDLKSHTMGTQSLSISTTRVMARPGQFSQGPKNV